MKSYWLEKRNIVAKWRQTGLLKAVSSHSQVDLALALEGQHLHNQLSEKDTFSRISISMLLRMFKQLDGKIKGSCQELPEWIESDVNFTTKIIIYNERLCQMELGRCHMELDKEMDIIQNSIEIISGKIKQISETESVTICCMKKDSDGKIWVNLERSKKEDM